MSFKVEIKTNFSPLGHCVKGAAKRNCRLCVLGIRTSGVNRTFSGMKQNKEDKELNMQKGRLALKGLLSLASSFLINGITDNASESDNLVVEEQELPVDYSQMEQVSEFGLCSRSLDTVIRALVKRPKMKKELEILVVDGIENLEHEEMARFDVYMSKAFGDMVDSSYGEFVGNEADCCNGSLEIDITNLAMAIGAEESENIVVTLVPRTGKALIGGVRVVAKRAFGNIRLNNCFTYRKDERRKLITVDLKHQLLISENISLSVGLFIWLMPYFILLMPQVKDVLGDLARMLQ